MVRRLANVTFHVAGENHVVAVADQLRHWERGNALEGEHHGNDTGPEQQSRATPSRLNPCIQGFEVGVNCAAAAVIMATCRKSREATMRISSSGGASMIQPLVQLGFRQFAFPGPAHPQRIDQSEEFIKSGVGFHRRWYRTVKRLD